MIERKIAIVAVHGVGDHQAGVMSADLARELLKQDASGYSAFEASGVTIGVNTSALGIFDVQPRQVAPGSGALSDGVDSRLLSHAAQPPAGGDAGLAFTETLLAGGKNYRSSYTTCRLESVFQADGVRRSVHIHELFWADLSHGGIKSGIAVLSQLMQLFLHLASLGRTAMAGLLATMPADDPAKRRIGHLYRASMRGYWLLSVPILLGNILLLIIGALLLPLLIPDEARWAKPAAALAAGTVLAAFAGFAVAAQLRKAKPPRWAANVGLTAVLAGGIAVASLGLATAWDAVIAPKLAILGLAALLLLAGATALIDRYEHSRPGALRWWCYLLALVAGWAAGGVWTLHTHAMLTLLTWFEFVVEGCFAILILAWAVLYYVNLYLLAMSIWTRLKLAKDTHGIRQTIDTSLIAASLPAPLFILVILTLWAAYANMLARSGPTMIYQRVPSLLLGDAQSTLSRIEQLINLSASPGALPYLLCLLTAIACAVLALLPSILAELLPRADKVPTAERSRGLGNWLDAGFRLLHGGGRVALAGWLIILPIFALLDYLPGWPKNLAPLGITLGGTALIYLAATKLFAGAFFGSVSRFFARLRVVVDTAIDVDNWLRERPVGATPRLHMMARYASLLSHLTDQGYHQIIVVAHSQGAVITVDLFRYLHSHGSALLSPLREIHLLTVGCPLRQLYAARFSALYGWAVNPQLKHTGLASWTNAYGSGDYVGRNLWDDHGGNQRWNPGRPAGATEFCVGPIAHTHYFDGNAPAVTAVLAELIARA